MLQLTRNSTFDARGNEAGFEPTVSIPISLTTLGNCKYLIARSVRRAVATLSAFSIISARAFSGRRGVDLGFCRAEPLLVSSRAAPVPDRNGQARSV